MPRLLYLVLNVGLLLEGTSVSPAHLTPSDDTVLNAFEDGTRMDYNKYALPDVSEGPVMLDFQPSFERIIGLDVDTQILTVHMDLAMYWNDRRLEQFVDTFPTRANHKVFYSTKDLWTPDIRLYNSADPNRVHYEDEKAIIYPSGHVHIIPRLILQSFCPVDVDIKEAETVNCTMEFGSWLYNQGEVDFKPLKPVEALRNKHSREWKLVKSTLEKKVVKYSFCPEQFVSAVLVLELEKSTHSSSDPDLETTTHPYSDPELETTTHSSSDPELETTTHSSSDPELETTTHSSSDPELETTTHSSSDPELETTTHSSSDPELETTTHSFSDPELETTIHPSSDPELETTTHSSSDPELETTIHSSSDPELETTIHPFSDPELETTTHPSSDPELETTTHSFWTQNRRRRQTFFGHSDTYNQ